MSEVKRRVSRMGSARWFTATLLILNGAIFGQLLGLVPSEMAWPEGRAFAQTYCCECLDANRSRIGCIDIGLNEDCSDQCRAMADMNGSADYFSEFDTCVGGLANGTCMENTPTSTPDRHADRNTDGDPERHCDDYAHGYADRDALRHADRNPDRYCDRYSNGHTDRDGYTDTDQYQYAGTERWCLLRSGRLYLRQLCRRLLLRYGVRRSIGGVRRVRCRRDLHRAQHRAGGFARRYGSGSGAAPFGWAACLRSASQVARFLILIGFRSGPAPRAFGLDEVGRAGGAWP